jgi:hypothetical protein
MNQIALKTIRNQNSKWTVAKCKKHAQGFINLINKNLPEGASQYFVIPGFEHVTKNQPIISFTEEGEWVLDINTKFKI